MIKRAIFYGTSQDKFNKHFTNDDDCFKYLSEIKWKDDTFVCTRCGNTHYCKGHLPFSRRCTKCKHDESPTAGTVFDKLKFSLNTAFHIAFNLCTSENGVTSTVLSIRIKTKNCLGFQTEDTTCYGLCRRKTSRRYDSR